MYFTLKKLINSLFFAALLGTLINSACADTATTQVAPEPLSKFPQSTLAIHTPDGRQHAIRIWLADSDVHRQQGLMWVKSLPDKTGMLFVFDRPQQIQMWMKNTLIPLDMLFIDANGRIDSIAVNTTPMSLKIIAAENPVLGVLELAGGSTSKLGIKAGAIVKFPTFGSVRGSR